MAPFVPLPGGAQVELIFDLGGAVVSNRLWFIFDNPPYTGSNLQALANGVAAWHQASVLPALSHDLVLSFVRATDWNADPPANIAINVVEVAGADASGSHSANVAVVVPFLWPVDVRQRRNKNYVSGIPLSGVDLNTVQPGLQDALFEGYAALVDAARLFLPVLNWRWVATSAYEGGSARAEQYWASIQGPPIETPFVLGQRRRRLA